MSHVSRNRALSPLPARSTGDYLATRLLKAGAHGGAIFTKESQEEIFRRSGGVPRLINLIASRALMAAYLEGRTSIELKQVKIASEEVMKHERKTAGYAYNRKIFILVATSAVILTLISLITSAILLFRK